MDKLEELMVITMEECGELIQECSKSIRMKDYNRDELKDKGAEIWYQTITLTKKLSPETTIETLIPDVRGNWDALYRMIDAGQEVVSHNIETVESLYKRVRPQARYSRSLELIKITNERGKRTKSGIMVGLGEKKEEVFKTMDDMVEHGLHILTIGHALCKIS